MKSTTKKPIPRLRGHVNHVFNGDLIYLMATLENRLIDTVNELTDEVSELKSRIDALEKERSTAHEEGSMQ